MQRGAHCALSAVSRAGVGVLRMPLGGCASVSRSATAAEWVVSPWQQTGSERGGEAAVHRIHRYRTYWRLDDAELARSAGCTSLPVGSGPETGRDFHLFLAFSRRLR
jgi:hypothetical protein